MKRKLKQNHKLIFEDILKQVQKEKEDVQVAFFSSCSKFKGCSNQTASLDRALQYLWLKEQQVDKTVALHFGKRRVCKIDSTREVDGPATARVFPTRKIPEGTVNGWHNGTNDPKYELGPEYQIDGVQQAKSDEIYENFAKHEAQIPSDIKSKITDLLEYNRSLNGQFKFTGLTTQHLYKRLQEIKDENRVKNETPIDFVEVRGQRFFHILNDIQDYLDQKRAKSTLIQDMRAFQSLSTLRCKLKVRQLPPGESMDSDIPTNQPTKLRDTGRQESFGKLRKRAFTNAMALAGEQFNTTNYVFNVKEVPDMGKQMRINNFNKVLQQMQRNNEQTPREAEDDVTTRGKSTAKPSIHMQKPQKPQKHLSFKLSLQTSEHVINNNRQSIARSISTKNIIDNKLNNTPQRQRSIVASSTDSPHKRITKIEQKMCEYGNKQIESTNHSRKLSLIDCSKLQQKYEMIQTERQKQVKRMYKPHQYIEVGNENLVQFLNAQNS